MKRISYLTLLLFALLLGFSSCGKDKVYAVHVSPKKVSLYVGETQSLNVSIDSDGDMDRYPITYKSSDENIVTINNQGIITAVGVGETRVNVSAGGKIAYCDITVVSNKLHLTTATSNFWGDIYRNNTHVFDFYGLEKSLGIADNGDIVGSGIFLYLDLNISAQDYSIAQGRYVCDNSGAAYTFMRGSLKVDNKNKVSEKKGSYVQVLENSEMTDIFVVEGGELQVVVQNNYYTITGYVEVYGGRKLQVDFSGEIPMEDNVTPMPKNLTQGSLTYYGDTDGYGRSALFGVRLGDSTTNINDFSDGFDKMALEVGVSIGTSKFEIPNGTYKVQNTRIAKSGMLLGGFIDNDKNNFGSWYYTADQYQLTEGEVTFQKEGTIYNIAYDLRDKYFGHRILGTWKGELAYFNEESKSVASKIRRMQEIYKITNEVTRRANVKSRMRTDR